MRLCGQTCSERVISTEESKNIGNRCCALPEMVVVGKKLADHAKRRRRQEDALNSAPVRLRHDFHVLIVSISNNNQGRL